MGMHKTVWDNPADLIRHLRPDHPVMAFAPTVLHDRARQFLTGFPGLVTYAVKANPDEAVIRTLVTAGIRGFDVASPWEIDLVGRLAPCAARHYNNPVRSGREIAHAIREGILSWSVDSRSELDKLAAQVPVSIDGQRVEISVRFKLPVLGAAYDFGSKFGATPELAADLLGLVADRGHAASLTFHPGTQCVEPVAWESYIRMAREICDRAGVPAHRLNVGGGFPSHRVTGVAPDLNAIFARIGDTTRDCFGSDAPALVCEPGRGLCADAFALITRVKAVRDEGGVFLNDGVYGGLAELPVIGTLDRIEVLTPRGAPRTGERSGRVLFGPTCDSVDRLPGELALPADMAEDDYVVFHGAGAYSTVISTRFNGFGAMTRATVMGFD